MPVDIVPAYHAVVAIVVLATLVPPFALVVFARGQFRMLLAYGAGLVCGIVVLYAESYILNFIGWDEILYVLYLPLVGMTAGAALLSRKRRHVIGALVLVAGALLIVITNARSIPTSIDVPFAAGSKGAIVDTEFSVPTAMTYAFTLDLRFAESDRRERDRLEKLAGTGQYRDGRQINTGLPIPVRLRVERLDKSGAASILDAEFTDHDLESHGSGHFSKRVTYIRLEPARYRAKIEALEDIPALAGVTHFGIHVAGHK